MQTASSILIDIIKVLDIPEERKIALKKEVESGNITDSLFNELDKLIEKEIDDIDKETERLDKEIELNNKELEKETKNNEPKKESLIEMFRNTLKSIYEAAVMAVKRIVGEEDKETENKEHSKELDEANNIKKNLGL